MADGSVGTTRRTLVRGAAWSVPVVAMAATAPAFAASPCAAKTAALPVTWAASGTTTSLGGTTTNGTTVTVAAAYTRTTTGGGSLNSGNLATSTATSTRDSFAISNNSPTSLSLDASANYQTVTFTFSVPVFALSFSIDDIDRGTGYWDQVSLVATPAETPGSTLGANVNGAGYDNDPWKTTLTSGGTNDPGQTVNVAYANGLVGITSLRLRFWSTLLPATSAQHVLRLRQMSFRTCV